MKILLPATLTLGLAAPAVAGVPLPIAVELADARTVANYMRSSEHYVPSLYADVRVYRDTLQLDGGYRARIIYRDEGPEGVSKEDMLTVMIDGIGILPPLTRLDLNFRDEGLDGIRHGSSDEVIGLDDTIRPADLTDAGTARTADRIYANALRLIAGKLNQ